MKILKFNLIILLTLFVLSSCQTIKQKTDDIVKKENEKLSQFIGQPVSELKIELGMPDKQENKILIYNTKKYGLLTIACERIVPEYKKKKLIEIK